MAIVAVVVVVGSSCGDRRSYCGSGGAGSGPSRGSRASHRVVVEALDVVAAVGAVVGEVDGAGVVVLVRVLVALRSADEVDGVVGVMVADLGRCKKR